MSQFTTPCRVEVVGKNLFRLIEPFEYHVGEYPSEQVIIVPENFLTDFATVPRIFWSIISPIDNHAKAAVLHDWMYEVHYAKKSECERIFKEALEVLEVKKWKIFCLYWGVYLFGWYKWIKLRLRDRRNML